MKRTKSIPLETTHILTTSSQEKISGRSRQGACARLQPQLFNLRLSLHSVFISLIPAWPPGSSLPNSQRERKSEAVRACVVGGGEGRGLSLESRWPIWSQPCHRLLGNLVSITNSDTRSNPRHIISPLQNHLFGEFVVSSKSLS